MVKELRITSVCNPKSDEALVCTPVGQSTRHPPNYRVVAHQLLQTNGVQLRQCPHSTEVWNVVYMKGKNRNSGGTKLETLL